MAGTNVLTPESFEALLAVLSEDRDAAGIEYEKIRSGLVRFFSIKGCSDAEQLADVTINRVATKIDFYEGQQAKQITAYFYGFAMNVLREHWRRRQTLVDIPHELAGKVSDDAAMEASETRENCLSDCLAKLSNDERGLFIEYFGYRDEQRITLRRKLCGTLGITSGALHARVFRIKSQLRACITECVGTA